MSKPWAEVPDDGQRHLPLGHQGRAALRDLPEQGGAEAQLHDHLRRHRAQPGAPLPRDRFGLHPRQDRAVHGRPALPGLPGSPAEAVDSGRARGRTQHLRDQPAVGGQADPLPERIGAQPSGGADRRPGAQGDSRAAELPRVGGRGLSQPASQRRLAVGRRGAAHPAGDSDRLQPGGRALHPRRALHRPAPARQPAPHRDPAAPARPGQHGDRRGARRGDHALAPTTSSTWDRGPASTGERS